MDDFYGTGIRNRKAARKYLRAKFNLGQLEAIQIRPGARFYVTARQTGTRVAFLLGPYTSHTTALAAVPRGQQLLSERLPDHPVTIGTSSLMTSRPTIFGR